MHQMKLAEAAREGDFEAVAGILAQRVGFLDDYELNDALCQAALYGHEEIVRFLLRHGPDVNARPRVDMAPLDCAVEGMHGAIVELLLSAGADINAKDGYGTTALHRALDIEVENSKYKYDVEGAVTTPSTAITGILVEHGADLNAPDYKGRTPLQLATALGHEAAEKLLRARGAGPAAPHT
jgi:ankyrin repeat protein